MPGAGANSLSSGSSGDERPSIDDKDDALDPECRRARLRDPGVLALFAPGVELTFCGELSWLRCAIFSFLLARASPPSCWPCGAGAVAAAGAPAGADVTEVFWFR